MGEKLTIEIDHGDGAYGTIPNPASYENGGVAWRLTYGDYEQARWPATSIIDTFDYLISPSINLKEAARRLAQFRRAYRSAIPPRTPTMAEIDEAVMKKARDCLAGFTKTQQVVNVARALMAEREADKWQPIETAPKDGTAIIGAFFDIGWADSHRKHDIVSCWFQPEFDAFISSCRQIVMRPGLTINGKTSKLHSPVIEPITHWMPLPPPPASKGAPHDPA